MELLLLLHPKEANNHWNCHSLKWVLRVHLTDQGCLMHKRSQSARRQEFPKGGRKGGDGFSEALLADNRASWGWTLTTAFFGLACSWDISSSCSGVHTRTLLRTLNQPLQTQMHCQHFENTHLLRNLSFSCTPCILRWLCKHLIGPLVGHNVQSVFLFVVIHYLPVKTNDRTHVWLADVV